MQYGAQTWDTRPKISYVTLYMILGRNWRGTIVKFMRNHVNQKTYLYNTKETIYDTPEKCERSLCETQRKLKNETTNIHLRNFIAVKRLYEMR